MKRTLVLGAAWIASAAAAVGLGFLAVSLVGASASPGTIPVASGATSSPAGTSTPASPTVPPPVVSSAEQVTVGGTVFADCTGGTPGLAGAPAPGWWVDDSDDPGEVEFTNGAQKVEVHTVCAGGAPRFSVEGPRADDSGSGPSSSSSPAPGPASESTSGGDDPGGDDSGGRGRGGDDSGGDDPGSDDSASDDSGGDDSSGRDGGGHGEDD